MTLNYHVYKIEQLDAVLDRQVECEAHDHDQLKELRFLHKDPNYYVKGLDSDSIWHLVKPQRRGAAKLSDELVIKIFEIKANQKLSAQQISSVLKKECGVSVSGESVANVLKRKTYTDVLIPDNVLERANQKVMRRPRSTITYEDSLKIIEYHNQGLSGRQISQLDDMNYSDVTINRFLRKKFGNY